MDDCFGYFSGSFSCTSGSCKMSQQCKAVRNSDFMDAVGDVIDSMVENLPTQRYLSTISIRSQLQQILHPERVIIPKDDPAPMLFGEVSIEGLL